MEVLDWMKEKLGITVQPEFWGGWFRIRKAEKRTQIIKNYNNETIAFVDNWDLTHFEELRITQDGKDTKITLPNNQKIIVRNKQANLFSYANFLIPNTGVGFYDGMPRKFYTGTEGNDSQYGVWTVDSILKGLGGDDQLLGGQGNDGLYGGDGDDRLSGGDGDDILEGNAGNDKIWGGNGVDYLFAGEGNDLLEGDHGNDFLYGGQGNDTLKGDDGDDTLDGGEGNDLIDGGMGANTLTGGLGSDTFIISPDHGQKETITDFDPQTDTLNLQGDIPRIAFENITFTQVDSDTLVTIPGVRTLLLKAVKKETLKAENFTLNGSPMPRAYYEGTPGDDLRHGYHDVKNIIYGNAGDDRLTGANLEDKIYGGEGKDWISSGAGDDFVDGGSGDDKIEAGSGHDSVVGGKGSDLICGEEGDDKIWGDEGDDFLQGEEGDDVIYGESGDDYIRGDRGNNTLTGGTGIDHFIIASRANEQDIIVDYDFAREKIYFDNSSIQSFSQLAKEQNGKDVHLRLPKDQTLILKNVKLSDLNPDFFIFDSNHMPRKTYVGTKEKDYISGHKMLSSTLSGLGGADRLWGGDYGDIIHGGDGDDTLEGGGGNDIIYGDAGNDSIEGEDGDDTLYAGDGSNFLSGDAGNDTLYSGLGRNGLFGGIGEDTLHILGPGQFSGGAGKDIFKVHVAASSMPMERSESARSCRVGDTSKGYQEVVITDFDPTEKGEKIDLSSFQEITSFENLSVTETTVTGDHDDFGLCFDQDMLLSVIADYRKAEPTPLLTLSTKEGTPHVLVELYNVKKSDLKSEHFIFSSSSSSLSPSTLSLEEASREETTYSPDSLENFRSSDDGNHLHFVSVEDVKEYLY